MNWAITDVGPGGNVAFLLNRAVNLMRMPLAVELKDVHLNPQQGIMVLVVGTAADRGTELTPALLAERLGTDRPTVSAMLTKLVRMRWLATSPNPADGRSRTVHLGALGSERIGEVRAAADRAVARAVGCVSDEDLERLAELLNEIIGCMKADLES